jgi:hypothetical protein
MVQKRSIWVTPGLSVRVPVGSPVVAGLCEAGRSGRAGVVALGYNRRCYLALNYARGQSKRNCSSIKFNAFKLDG